jgi:hypothetical protein
MLMPTTDRLAFFYGRHGFKAIQAEPALMMRVPVHKLAAKLAEAAH